MWRVVPLLFLAGSLAYLLPGFVLRSISTPQSRSTYTSVIATTTIEASNLAYYVAAHRLDPIFAIEGTDPDKLQSALDSFLSEKDRVAKLYTKEQSQIIQHTLYPVLFLQELPKLEAARKALLTTPSADAALTYHILLEQTIGNYALGARAVASNMMRVQHRIPTLGFINGSATTSNVADKINAVAKAALQQKQKEEARFACLLGQPGPCPSLTSLENNRTAALAAVPPKLAPPNADMLKVDALSKRIVPITTSGFIGLSSTTYAISSSCYPGSTAYMHEYYGEQVPGKIKRKQLSINNMYFYSISKELTGIHNLPLYQAYTKAGVQLEYQSMGNLYMCPDSGFDVFNIGRLVGTLEALASSTLPERSKVFTLPLVQKSDLQAVVQKAAQTRTPENDAIVERFIEGSAHFDQVVMGAYSDNSFLIMWDKKQNPVQFEYMVIVRNFASTLFFMGNPTFVPQPGSLFDDHTPNKLKKLQLREYLTDVSKVYTDEEVLRQVEASAKINISADLRTK